MDVDQRSPLHWAAGRPPTSTLLSVSSTLTMLLSSHIMIELFPKHNIMLYKICYIELLMKIWVHAI